MVVVACLTLMGGAAYWYWGSPLAQQTQQKQKGQGFRRGGGNPADSVPVLAAAAKLADVPVYFDGVGTAKALNTVTVRPQVDGKLMKIMFTEGQEVSQGFILAKIDPTTYQAQYDQAVAKKAQDQATLTNAKLDLDRYTRLLATNAVNKQQADTQKAMVDQFTAQVQFDQAAIDNAKAILDYTDVVAPIPGLTGIRQVDEGNIVHTTDTTGIVTITEIKPITVLFNLPQQNLAALNKGMAQASLPVQALGPDGTSVIDNGKVVVINNQVDQTTGTVQLKAEFANRDVQLWPGQFVNVRVLINTLHQVVVVPTAAVQRGPDGTFVYVVQEDATVSMRPVTVSQQDDQQAVIATGLTAPEEVVTTGFGRLADGTKVEVATAEQAGQGPADSSQRPNAGAPKGKGQAQGQGQRQGPGPQGQGQQGQGQQGQGQQGQGQQGQGQGQGKRQPQPQPQPQAQGEAPAQGQGQGQAQPAQEAGGSPSTTP
jgi:multidrug efflux system membrane fusion protein